VRRHADLIAILTLAPELPGGLGLVEAAAGAGVVVAAGHSDATATEIRQACERGLSHVVHLWSSQSTVRRKGPWRVPGLLEAALASDHLTCEVIADGRHLPPELLQIALRCAGGRLCVVSDATAGAGLAEGADYRLGEVLCRVEDGVGVVPGAGVFGGSTSFLSDMLRFLHETLLVPVPDLVAMASTLPAKILGLPHKGTLADGADADVVVFDGGLNVAAVILGGSVAHVSPELEARLNL
jgi:N-acetylglucosamine-6-phosphate deacetylase